jgi:hypothetical protein
MSKNAVMPLTDYQNACDAIREKTGTTDLIKSGEMAEKIMSISGGGDDGSYDEGFEDGKQTENQEFWTNFLSGLNQEDCRYAMAGGGWNDNSFNPNVSFTAAQGSNLGGFFYYSAIEDLAGILKRNNVVWDFSGALSVSNFAYNSDIVNFPLLDISGATDMSRAFYGLKGDNITLPIRLNDDGSQVFSSAFNGSTGLVNLTIYGTIGQNGFNVAACTQLTHDSLMSIINALKDYSTIGGTHTITLGTVNLAKLTDAEKAIATQKGWTLL